MFPLQVKKVVAVCFLEAAKMTLEQLAAYRLELSQKGINGSADLPRIYGETRRLRDYLQRCVSAFQDQVEIDLSKSDQALLTACCRRSVEATDMRLGGDMVLPPDEREWLQKKRQVVGDWTVEMAEKPLLDLPIPRLNPVQSEAMRALQMRITTKLFGDVHQRAKIRPPNTMAAASATAGVRSIADELAAQPPDELSVTPNGFLGNSLIQTSVTPELPQLVDVQKMHDPRLRSLAGLDLRSYERALAADDYRMATVLLGTLVEAAIIDHALPRKSELGLAGTPDTWNPQELLVKVMGDALGPQDRALSYHLFAARNMLRPAVQILSPTVVTATSFDRLTEFAQRALHQLGFAGSPPLPE